MQSRYLNTYDSLSPSWPEMLAKWEAQMKLEFPVFPGMESQLPSYKVCSSDSQSSHDSTKSDAESPAACESVAQVEIIK